MSDKSEETTPAPDTENNEKSAPAPVTDAQKRRILLFSVVLIFLALVLVIFLISGGEETKSDPDLLTGIQQNGMTLGDPDAPITLAEFGDLQCPACRQYSVDVVPDIIEGPVRNGDVKLVFYNFNVLGEDSETAAAAALAAGEQDKGWDYVKNFYDNQGLEKSGYVTDEFLLSIAEKSGLDIPQWEAARNSEEIKKEVADAHQRALDAGFEGTPTFAIETPDGELLRVEDSGTSESILNFLDQMQAQLGS